MKENKDTTKKEIEEKVENTEEKAKQKVEKVFDVMEEMGVDVLKDDFEDEPNEEELVLAKKDGKWGFVTQSGDIVSEAVYAQAKSFANGYAAFCNEQGLWGFLDEECKQIVEPQYLEAGYFTESRTCLVS